MRFATGTGKIVNAGGAVFLTLFAIPFVAGQLAGMAILGYSTSILMIFFLLLASFINYLFYHLLKAPTRAGRNILDAIEGFKVFLSATEKERLNMLNPPQKTPELFEKYLPYALALDIEQQWAEQFADILSGAAEGGAKAAYAPVWYTGAALSSNDIRRLCLFPGKFVFRRDIVILYRPGFEFGQRWWRLIRRWRRRWRWRRMVAPGAVQASFIVLCR